MRYLVVFVFLFLSQISFAYDRSEKVDFDISMGKASPLSYKFMFRHPESVEHYHTFRKIFNNNFHNKSQELQIPKIIHQMWLGSPMPKFFESYIKTCQKLHPDWEYRFWTEKDLHKLSYNKEVVQNITKRLDITKDYLMHVILAKYGGVFMDVDYACFKPLDQLNYQYDAWFAIEPGGWWNKIPSTNFSIIAAKPSHPLIHATLHDIEQYVLDKDFRIKHNESYTAADLKSDRIFASVQLLGGINIVKYCKSNDCSNIMTFPPTYFLPQIDMLWILYNIKKSSFLDKIRLHLGFDNDQVVFEEIKPETIAMNDFNAKYKINPFYYKEKYYGD